MHRPLERARLWAAAGLAAVLAVAAGGSGVAVSASAPQVVVARSGWTQTLLGQLQGEVSYGLVLANRSTDRDALRVAVEVDAVGTGGAVLASDSRTISVVPAGGTFYLGGGYPVPPLRVARLRASVVVGATEPRRLVLPPVSDVRLLDRFRRSGTLIADAVLSNPYGQALRVRGSQAYVVVFDRGGSVVGGGAVDLGDAALAGAVIAPGARVALSFYRPGHGVIPVERAAVARVSVDPGAILAAR